MQLSQSVNTPLMLPLPLLLLPAGADLAASCTCCCQQLPSMTYEGALWFNDLTVPDPFMALPVMCAAATWLQFNSQRFKDQAMSQTSPQTMAMMKPLMSFMAVVIMFAGYFQPSAIALLWASNSLLMIGQNSLLSNPGVRKFVQLPPLEAAGPASSSSSSSDSSLAGLMARLSGQQEQGKQAVPASQVKAPPPGTPVAVNYVSKRPKRHIKVV
jgi:membrane protein insertase Oxa1/YidC/SpoIIIJ